MLANAVFLFRKNSSIARLYSLAVSPESQRTGVASKLLTATEKELVQQNIQEIRLEVKTDNFPAIRFYEKMGYVIFGEYKNFYEDGKRCA